MQTASATDLVTHPQGLLRRLVRVALPGKVEARAKAAGSLPIWLAGLVMVISLVLLAEIITYNVLIIDRVENTQRATWQRGDGLFDDVPRNHAATIRNFAWQEVQWHALPWVFSRWEYGFWSIVGLAGVLVLLEILYGLSAAPLGAAFGQKIGSCSRQCRKVLYLLGGPWLVTMAVPWTLAVVFVVPQMTAALSRRGMTYDAHVLAIMVCGVAVPLALLMGWMFRLRSACAIFAEGSPVEAEARCGECGYFLEGLAEGAACPECGLPNPGLMDEMRRPNIWARSRGVWRIPAMFAVLFAVLLGPGRFFERMRVLGQARESRRFFVWVLWLSVPIGWLAAVPAMWTAAHSSDGRDERFLLAGIGVMVTVFVTVCLVPLLGLVSGLMGLAINRARQEPAWPIAAAAGAYLAGLVPWIYIAQGLWLWPVAELERGNRLYQFCRELALATRTDADLWMVLIFIAPGIVGLFVLIRLAVVCYKHVRYAWR